MMRSVRGTVQNGEIILDEIPDWPNGTQVTVRPLADWELVETVAEEGINNLFDAVTPTAVIESPGGAAAGSQG